MRKLTDLEKTIIKLVKNGATSIRQVEKELNDGVTSSKIRYATWALIDKKFLGLSNDRKLVYINGRKTKKDI